MGHIRFTETGRGLVYFHATYTGVDQFSKNRREPRAKDGGGERIRTANPQLAKLVLSQLSYAPARGKSGGPE